MNKGIATTHSATKKLELMEHALITVKKMNLEDKEAFSKKLGGRRQGRDEGFKEA